MESLFPGIRLAEAGRCMLFFALTLFATPVFSQLDSVEAHIELVPEPYYDVNDTIWQDWMYLHVDPDDPDDLGRVSIAVYNGGGGEVLTEIQLTRQELIDSSLFDGESIVLKLLFYDPQLIYRIEIYPQTLAGSYSWETVFIYPD